MRERFNALPKHVRDSILDSHRNFNTEHLDWWDSTEETFKDDMAKIGIRVDQILFSGFWSQGDGACFEGKVDDWPKFLAHVGINDLMLINLAGDYWGLSVTHSGHYYHKHCTRFSADLPLPFGVDDQDFAADHFSCERDSVEAAVQLTLLSKYNSTTLEERFIDVFRSHMDELYKRLEREHDDLTSDDAVLDALEGNELLEALITETEGEHA